MPSSLDPIPPLALAVVAVLVSTLPDPGSPTIVPLGVVAGGLIGAAVGRARRVGRNRTREIAENWGFAFGVLAAAVYLIALLAGI